MDYGLEYWSDKIQYLNAEDAAYIREEIAKRGVEVPIPLLKTTEVTKYDVMAMPPKERKRQVNRAQKQLTEASLEIYSNDNVEQCEELVEVL